MDIVAAIAWQHPQQCTLIHACESFHVSSNGGVFVLVLNITSLSTNEIGRYLNYLQKRKTAARGVTQGDFLGPCMDFLMTSYTHAILHDCEASRKARPSLATKCYTQLLVPEPDDDTHKGLSRSLAVSQ